MDSQLPNEILSEIVAVALLSSRLNEETDQLFIQPKSRVLFSALAGFGMSHSRFRVILLREWFVMFKVSSIDDIRDLKWRVPSCSVARFVRYVRSGLHPADARHSKAFFKSNILQ